MTWEELIADVRAQIDVDDPTAYAWLLDCARIMNAEADWLLQLVTLVGDGSSSVFALDAEVVKVEAVGVDAIPYRRSTMAQMDAARASHTTRPIYAEAGGGWPGIQILPVPRVDAAIVVRALWDIEDDVSGSPPFPTDLQSCLASGAIAVGLGRMDERFDSAGWFDARFADAIQRLRRRRHARAGRGATPIRVVT
jgi:hypothetical protein